MQIDIKDYDRKQFIEEISANGYCIVQNVIDKKQLQALKASAEQAIQKEAAYHGNTSYRDYGVVQACPL